MQLIIIIIIRCSPYQYLCNRHFLRFYRSKSDILYLLINLNEGIYKEQWKCEIICTSSLWLIYHLSKLPKELSYINLFHHMILPFTKAWNKQENTLKLFFTIYLLIILNQVQNAKSASVRHYPIEQLYECRLNTL